MTPVEYLKERKRMCDEHVHDCATCPFDNPNLPVGAYSSMQSSEIGCTRSYIENTQYEMAVAIVEKWSVEHPVRTYLDEFRKRFPKCVWTDEEMYDKYCPYALFGCGKDCDDDKFTNCKQCWLMEYKEDE